MIGTVDGKVGFFSLQNIKDFNINQNSFFDLVEIGSKINCCRVVASIRKFAFGCVDGRCCIS